MAVLTGSFQSQAVSRKISFSAILPTDISSIDDPGIVGVTTNQPLKTLYLLHGWDGNHEEWLHNTRIAELAIKYHTAFILADGQNSFYVDQPNGDRFGQYIGEELVHQTRQLFHLSDKREDTAIGGLSMGGYGALRTAFYYGETFGSIVAFSSKLFSKRANEIYDGDSAIEKRLRSIFGSSSTSQMPEDLDLEQLAVRSKQPNLFLACGTEDELAPENRLFHQFLLDNQYEHKYFETAGGHDWIFWNAALEQSMEWLHNSLYP